MQQAPDAHNRRHMYVLLRCADIYAPPLPLFVCCHVAILPMSLCCCSWCWACSRPWTRQGPWQGQGLSAAKCFGTAQCCAVEETVAGLECTAVLCFG